jgi:hypothetical protein
MKNFNLIFEDSDYALMENHKKELGCKTWREYVLRDVKQVRQQ